MTKIERYRIVTRGLNTFAATVNALKGEGLRSGAAVRMAIKLYPKRYNHAKETGEIDLANRERITTLRRSPQALGFRFTGA